MQFVLRTLSFVEEDRLEATFNVVHAKGSMSGQVALVIPFVQSDTIEQLTIRAGQALEVAMVEGDD